MQHGRAVADDDATPRIREDHRMTLKGTQGTAFGLLAAMLALVVPGCTLGVDVLNPNALAFLGIDPAFVTPPPARVIVAFNNDTDFQASFFVAVSDDTRDPTSNAQGIPGVLDAGDAIANVLECPVGVITPGAPSADFSTDTVATQVSVVGADGTELVDVTYTGSPLVFGRDFRCGDVIEVRLVQTEAVDDTQQADFQLRLTVIPGN
jgi:hypothetical protein